MNSKRPVKRGPGPAMVPFLEVCARLGISRSTGYLMVSEGTFPIRVYRLRGWIKCRESDVTRFFESEEPPAYNAVGRSRPEAEPCPVCQGRPLKALRRHMRRQHPEQVAS